MVTEQKADIFLVETDAIIHQANCQHTMGSGIARIIREKHPEAYEADLRTKKNDRAKMGRCSVAKVVSPPDNWRLKYIFNLYSQFEFGLNKRHTEYDAMNDGLVRIRDYVKSELNPKLGFKIEILAVPFRMGCDRGGGDWRVARAIIDSVFADDKELTLLICDNTGLSPNGPANAVSK